MMRKSVAEWLQWQESLSPSAIDLGLDRIRAVAERLPIESPAGGVFTIAGTNGKGSSAHFLDVIMRSAGHSTAVYSSPHLVRYNERISLNGAEITDAGLIESFEAVEKARQDAPLTFFEFGTLAALVAFARARVDVWILEVGLGGRLDAVNIVEPDYSLITTIALDHQEWLGQTVEEIAAEKAGIMRPEKPVFYGDTEVPKAIVLRAQQLAAPLYCAGRDFNYQCSNDTWNWQGQRHTLTGLTIPALADGTQMRNLSLVLAAVEAHDATLLTRSTLNDAGAQPLPAGRFQIIDRDRHQWVLDVAHNPQAARVLRDRIALLGDVADRTAVLSMLNDKDVDGFVAELTDVVDRWIVCTVEDPRAPGPEPLALQVATRTGRPVIQAMGPTDSFEKAERLTGTGGRILVCGSFRIVGPALEWLGLY